MPDYGVMGLALAASAAAAALVLLAAAWPWRRPHCASAQDRLGIRPGRGHLFRDAPSSGSGRAGRRRRTATAFSPSCCRRRSSSNSCGALLSRPRWVAWLLRLGLAAAAAPILLHHSTYLTDLSGPHSAEWSPAQAAAILLGLGGVLAAVWGLLALLQARTSERSAAPSLALTSLAAALTVMLSGYYRGGLLGLPLAGAVAGATLASFAAPAERGTDGCLGVAVIGLFSVLLIGRFFGSLPTASALSCCSRRCWRGSARRPACGGCGRSCAPRRAWSLSPCRWSWVVTRAMLRFAEESAAHYGP